ncbi:MAG: transposase [Janthinobacterium lividum]
MTRVLRRNHRFDAPPIPRRRRYREPSRNASRHGRSAVDRPRERRPWRRAHGSCRTSRRDRPGRERPAAFPIGTPSSRGKRSPCLLARERRIMARIETTRLSLDIRFVVTNVERSSPEWIYHNFDCAQRQIENLIKLHKLPALLRPLFVPSIGVGQPSPPHPHTAAY